MALLCAKCGLEVRAYAKHQWCKACLNAYGRAWYAQHKSQHLSRKREERHTLKDLVFQAYGGAFCKCCGEADKSFLCIDHVEGNGNAHRKSISRKAGAASFYNWLKKESFPVGFQVLCYNCNMSKHQNRGLCSHQLADIT